MAAIIMVVALFFISGALFITGTYILLGLGATLIVAGLFTSLAMTNLKKGLKK